jgi:hypothetical protein
MNKSDSPMSASYCKRHSLLSDSLQSASRFSELRPRESRKRLIRSSSSDTCAHGSEFKILSNTLRSSGRGHSNLSFYGYLRTM